MAPQLRVKRERERERERERRLGKDEWMGGRAAMYESICDENTERVHFSTLESIFVFPLNTKKVMFFTFGQRFTATSINFFLSF